MPSVEERIPSRLALPTRQHGTRRKTEAGVAHYLRTRARVRKAIDFEETGNVTCDGRRRVG